MMTKITVHTVVVETLVSARLPRRPFNTDLYVYFFARDVNRQLIPLATLSLVTRLHKRRWTIGHSVDDVRKIQPNSD